MRRFAALAVIGLGVWVDAMASATEDAGRAARRTPIVRVIEECRDAVVNISTTRVVQMRGLTRGGLLDDLFWGPPPVRNRRVQSVGSGVIVHESGYIVTNHHVVSQALNVSVTFANGRTLPAEVVATDQEHDLAVLKVDARRPLAHLKLGRSDDIMIGETVIAIGNPHGLHHSVSAGIVSALDRDIEFSPNVVYRGLIQTDAPINPGNSGGPLLNINGELIGINSAIRGDSQNIGFAIPVDRIWELLPVMLDVERRQRVRFGLRVSGQDAQVVAVRPDTPAARAKLQAGDRVVALNDDVLRDGIDYYVHLLEQQPDRDVRLRVRRGDETMEVAVPLESIPIPDGVKLARELLGMELQEIPKDWYRKYDLPDSVGLVVTKVTPRGPADRIGIVPTDFILRLDRLPVMSLQDVGLALERVERADPVPVEGLRIDAARPFLWTGTLRAAGRR